MTKRADLPGHAAVIRFAGELLEMRGKDLWTRTRDWQPGLHAATISTGIHQSGGDVSDPTGQAAVHGEEDIHLEFIRLSDRAVAACRDLLGLMQSIPEVPGRRWLTDAFLAEVADVYRRHTHQNPAKAVEMTFDVPSKTARYYVGKARERGLLPATTPGRKLA